jgi:two-component system chemotaxis response regulator CheB
MTSSTTNPLLKTRILVVDDSPIFRNYWRKLLSDQPDLEVIGHGENGQVAIEKSLAMKPDLLIIDIEMPVMDGLTAIPLLLKDRPELRILVASSLTKAGSGPAIEALARGAADYLAKPQGQAATDSLETLRSELLQKVRAIAKRPEPTKTAPPSHLASTKRGGPISAIAIGSSTGGPNALEIVLKSIPSHCTPPIFITQHMPKYFLTALAARIGKIANRPCREPVDGEVIKEGHIYVAPGDVHLQFRRSGPQIEAILANTQPENYCRPAVDPMFRSLANIYSSELLAVVLTGMGEDGAKGARDIVERGGQVIVQDEATSVVWGMPGAVAKAGLASKVLPIHEIGPFVWDRIQLNSEILKHG